MAKLAPLPITIGTFRTLRNGGYLYIDKTEHAYNLITGTVTRLFLSRPRRFGKSLFASLLKEVLAGNRVLCEGLWIDRSDYMWHRHGVIALDLSVLGATDERTFHEGLLFSLQQLAYEYELNSTLSTNISIAFRELVTVLHAKYGRVAVLIDEYDSPILGMLHNRTKAEEIRSAIQRFFSIIKALDSLINFVFITGVSSFAKAGLFSGLNNLHITNLGYEYATICGYTDTEIDRYCKAHIEAWACESDIPYEQLRDRLREWYNGYLFAARAPKVYNPFSIMNALHDRQLKNFWFQSGTPKFLMNELQKRWDHTHRFDMFDPAVDPQSCKVTQQELGIFDVGATPLPALMFQTGYLTVASYNPDGDVYQLGYPNYEVKVSLQNYLLEVFTSLEVGMGSHISLGLKEAFQTHDPAGIVERLEQLFTRIPYHIQAKEEKFFHALLHMACIVAGIRCQSEYSTSHGRIDLVIECATLMYVIEVKFNASARDALAQIEERKYYQQFLSSGKRVILLGLAFMRGKSSFSVEYCERILDSST